MRDARISVAGLARISDRYASTIRRHPGELLGSGLLSIRCDTAPPISGVAHRMLLARASPWSWLVRLPASHHATAADVRVITGEASLVFTIYSRTFDDLAKFEPASVRAARCATAGDDGPPPHTQTHGLADRTGRAITGEAIGPEIFQD
jgi:hypothetical protein